MAVEKQTPKETDQKEKEIAKIKRAIWIYNKLIDTYPPIFIENLLRDYEEKK